MHSSHRDNDDDGGDGDNDDDPVGMMASAPWWTHRVGTLYVPSTGKAIYQHSSLDCTLAGVTFTQESFRAVVMFSSSLVVFLLSALLDTIIHRVLL